MLVYRVERNGEGPYQDWTLGFGWKHSNLKRTPPPKLDFENLPVFDTVYYFGFESLEAMTKWFIKVERKKLNKRDYTVGVYKINARYVKKGKKQVIFKLHKATKISQHNVLTLEKIGEAA